MAIDDITIRVNPGADLPVLYKPLRLRSPATLHWYEVLPRKIYGMRWHSDGALIVDMQAKKKLIDEANLEDEV